eukprot:2092073-Alexandrium_andersonii.AAC.1
MVDFSTPPRRALQTPSPLLLSPKLDPSAGAQQGRGACLAEVARTVNQQRGQLDALAGRVVGVGANYRALSEGAASA